MVSSAKTATGDRLTASDKQRIMNFMTACLSMLMIPVAMISLHKKLIDFKKKMIADYYTKSDGEFSGYETLSGSDVHRQA